MAKKKKSAVRHTKITRQTIEDMTFLLEECFDALNEFERDLLKDRFEAFKKYGMNSVCTPAQTRCIEDIYHRHKLIKAGDKAFSPFRELENAQSDFGDTGPGENLGVGS